MNNHVVSPTVALFRDRPARGGPCPKGSPFGIWVRTTPAGTVLPGGGATFDAAPAVPTCMTVTRREQRSAVALRRMGELLPSGKPGGQETRRRSDDRGQGAAEGKPQARAEG